MNRNISAAGFSLVEMAVVLAIVSLLLAGLLPMISSQMEQQRRTETRKLMEEISNALVGYAASQTPPKLPCPAKPTLATGTTNAGVADCTLTAGVVPWVTLGTSETDGWGRRFTYAVASSVAGTFTTSFTLTSVGNLDVYNANSGSCTTPIQNCLAHNVPAVIISHGPNGFGAYLTNGAQIPADATHVDELANSDGTTPFVSHDNTPDFDDLVIWISPNTLFNRMVAAGKLP